MIHRGIGIVVCVALLCGAARPTEVLVLDDFDSGVQRWGTNDALKQIKGGEATLCEIVPTAGPPDSRGKRAALFTFKRARETWASASLAVDGRRWNQIRANRISLWFKGDGSNESVILGLRVRTTTTQDELYGTAISLSKAEWQRLTIPLDRFTLNGRTVHEVLSAVRMIQFVKRGSWDSVFFSVDQLQVEAAADVVESRPGATRTETPSSASVSVMVDFGSETGDTRLRVGGNLGIHPDRFVDSVQFRQSVRDLGLRVIRVNTSGLVVSRPGADASSLDFTMLDRVIEAMADARLQPIVCLQNNPSWQLSEDAFPAFCANLVRRYSIAQKRSIAYWEVLDEPTSGAGAIPIQKAVAMYNKVREAIRAVDPKARVGGIGEGSAWSPHLSQMISRGDSLDFLSYHFYGSRNADASDTQVMDAGVRGLASDLPYQLAPRAVFQLISRSQSRANTPIFITECAPTSTRGRSGESSDVRLTRVFSGAWWMSFLMNAARWIDLVCVYDLTEDTWGFLDAQGRAFPAFYATWIFNTYVPPGAKFCKSESNSPTVLVFGVNTKTAHNIVLINTTGEPITVSLTTSGINAPLSMVRTRGVQDTNGLKASYLDRSTTQQITLNGFAVEMVQFVETTQ